jgi:pilus assembly protein CpaB
MRRGRVLFLFALILIGVALMVYLVISRPLVGAPSAEPTPVPRDAKVVVAAQNIPRGAPIPIDAVILADFPADMVVETWATDIDQVLNRWARIDIPRGMPITLDMVTDEAGDLLAAGSDAAIAIPRGMTAISIPMTRLSGVSYALRPGDRVDVLAAMLFVDLDTQFQTILPNLSVSLRDAFGQGIVGEVNPEADITSEGGEEGGPPSPKPVGRAETEITTGELLFHIPSERQRPRLITQRIIENAIVLHVGTFPLEQEVQVAQVATGEEGAQEAAQGQTVLGETRPPDIVTLIVSPQDALVLNYAIKSGAIDLTLTLRSPQDQDTAPTNAVTLDFILANYNIPEPAKLRFGLEPRLDAIEPPKLPNDQPVPQ